MPSALLIAALWFAADPVDSQPAQTAQDQKAQNAARLKFMKETAARIEIRVEGKEATKLELRAQPVLRYDNNRSFIFDAATFVWLADHRPQAIGGTWLKNRQDYAFFDLQSLSQQLLTVSVDGTQKWTTSQAGISWQAAAGATPPAASRLERLRQMKQLAEGFSTYAVKTAPDYDEGSIWHLRMLAQPIYRYAEEAAVDGALFAFAQGADPEVYLVLETRQDQGTAQWHFGFAAACGWELHAKRGEREVWSRPKWNSIDPVKDYGLVGPFAVDQKLLPTVQTPGG
ncbi:MAG TPA: hypothetical protein VGH74_22290 [Planctomycetaceae bacterium]